MFGEGGSAVIHPRPNRISWSFNGYITIFASEKPGLRAYSTTGLPQYTLTLQQDIKLHLYVRKISLTHTNIYAVNVCMYVVSV